MISDLQEISTKKETVISISKDKINKNLKARQKEKQSRFEKRIIEKDRESKRIKEESDNKNVKLSELMAEITENKNTIRNLNDSMETMEKMNKIFGIF